MGWLRDLVRLPEPEVAVASGITQLDAEMWSEILRDHGVIALIKAPSGGNLFWAPMSGTHYQLRVRERDLFRAREILGDRVDPYDPEEE